MKPGTVTLSFHMNRAGGGVVITFTRGVLTISLFLSLSQLSFSQPRAPDAPLEQLAFELDENANGSLDDAEVLHAVRLWISGTDDPPHAAISDAHILQLVRLWVGGRPFFGSLASHSPATVANQWFALARRLVQTLRMSPPEAARAYGYLGVALYEAVVRGMPAQRSLAGQLNGWQGVSAFELGKDYDWPLVVNGALAPVADEMLGKDASARNAIEALKQRVLQQSAPQASAEIAQRSARAGMSVGRAVLQWVAADQYDALYDCPFNPPQGSGLWEPTPPGHAPALQPCWGQLRPFALAGAQLCQASPPPAYDEAPDSAFYQEAAEVYRTVQNLTDEQKAIAEFWADNPGQTSTPPGHWISIVSQILSQRHDTLEAAAQAYARVGIALADAFITCWRTKFAFNLIRPISYIRDLMDPNWMPAVVTPPFPEYTSGHSVASGAAAQVLTDLWGGMAFEDRTHDALGLAPRSYDSFIQAAQEAAISRLYGGIHFRSAIENGVQQGICIGNHVNALRWKK